MKARAVAAFVPTEREFVLLALLLVTLLWFVPGNYDLNATRARALLSKINAGTVAAKSGSGQGVATMKEGETSVISIPGSILTWNGSVPETKILHHNPGWTVFDRLYIFKGTIFIVTSESRTIPNLTHITSSGYQMKNSLEEIRKRRPTERDIRIISPIKAARLFNTNSPSRLSGVSFINTDSTQFIAHYYHFSAEILFGLWRAYTALDKFITSGGYTTLPPPRRFMFRHVPSSGWRDYAELNQWVLRGAFPGISMEFKEDWDDRAAMQVPFVLDRVVLGDRAASYESEAYSTFWRYTASAFELRGSRNWWAPLRRSVLEFSGVAAEHVLGPPPGTQEQNEKYVITYVSRQGWGRRMLRQEDHENLVAELYKLRDQYGYEVNVVRMDKLSRAEQIRLAGRTTIMMGVHGNGLTSLLWMRPTPRSTVVEFFYPGGFAFDYEFTTRVLGMTHYSVWDNITFTQPDVPGSTMYPHGFQGNSIPVNGAVVAKLVHERLTLNSSDSDIDSQP